VQTTNLLTDSKFRGKRVERSGGMARNSQSNRGNPLKWQHSCLIGVTRAILARVGHSGLGESANPCFFAPILDVLRCFTALGFCPNACGGNTEGVAPCRDSTPNPANPAVRDLDVCESGLVHRPSANVECASPLPRDASTACTAQVRLRMYHRRRLRDWMTMRIWGRHRQMHHE
jgi:hypothetical protein